MKGRRFANKTTAVRGGERCLYGIHAVTGWLRHRPQCVHRVLVAAGSEQSPRIVEPLRLAQSASVPIESSSALHLTEIAGTYRHQGLAAWCTAFPYVDIDQVLGLSARLLLVIDQLQDPQNLGAILRSCDAAGVAAVILPKDGTVGITPVVEAAAAGAASSLRVCRVTNLVRTIELLKRHGFWIVGLAAANATSLYDADFPEPIALVLGGESGLRRLVRDSCDMRVSIPMTGEVESLNASVAAAVALYELRRRWLPRPG